jgi:hypothetical protein
MTSTLVLAALLQAANPFALSRQADEALARGDRPAAVRLAQEAAALVPHDARFVYELARIQAETGDPEAMVSLRRAVDLGAGLEASKEPAFAALRRHEAHRDLFARLSRAAEPAGSVRVMFTLPERDLIPEGIARDAKDGTLYLGSLNKHKVVRVDARGRATDFLAPRVHGLRAVLGLRVDPARRQLWVLTAADEREADPTFSAALVVDLASGRLVRRIEADKGGPHLWNDVALGPDGTAWITDSTGGAVHRIAPAATKAEVIADRLHYANGVTYDEGRRLVYVAHVFGVAILDPAGGPRRELTGSPLYGFDGLYAVDGSLVGVQNGFEPQRLVRLRLDEGGTRVVGVDVLASARPEFEVPTTAAPAGDRMILVGNSQLRRWQKDRNAPASTFDEPRILEVPLPSR